MFAYYAFLSIQSTYYQQIILIIMFDDEELNRAQIKPLIDSHSNSNVSLFDLIDRYQYYAQLTKQTRRHFICYFIAHVIISIFTHIRAILNEQNDYQNILQYFPEVIWLHLVLLFFGSFSDSQNIVKQIKIFTAIFRLNVFRYYVVSFLIVFLCISLRDFVVRRFILLGAVDIIIGALIFRSMLKLLNTIKSIDNILAEMKDKKMYLINSFVYEKMHDSFEDKIQRLQKSNSQVSSSGDKIRSSAYKFCHQETAEQCQNPYQQQRC